MRKIIRNMYRTPAVTLSDDGQRLVCKRGRFESNDRRPIGVSLSQWIKDQS